MKILPRYITKSITSDLKQKMVFLGGPRQVGKTTIAKDILGGDIKGYLNWDIAEHRERILKGEWPPTRLWVFDEIHKYRSWRAILKGLYDQFHNKVKILVTGSARLDFYRYGGDSLQGRYHYLRLHPLSVAELKIRTNKDMNELFILGGFPEPFFRGSQEEAKRWSREYRTRLIQDDLLSLERISDIGNLELMMLRLPELVGSPISINALREDLQISFRTAAQWLLILERLYALFRVSPFGSPKIRAVKKEQKHYHFDWTLIQNEAIRFENMVASHLLKWVHYLQDVKGEDIELRYFRDIDGREVDFVITKNRHPIMAVEAKWDQGEISKSLRYFKQRFPKCGAWQISAVGNKDYVSDDDIRVSHGITLLKSLI